jgi:hypothetical protein
MRIELFLLGDQERDAATAHFIFWTLVTETYIGVMIRISMLQHMIVGCLVRLYCVSILLSSRRRLQGTARQCLYAGMRSLILVYTYKHADDGFLHRMYAKLY